MHDSGSERHTASADVETMGVHDLAEKLANLG
jgi:hypothetical protein